MSPHRRQPQVFTPGSPRAQTATASAPGSGCPRRGWPGSPIGPAAASCPRSPALGPSGLDRPAERLGPGEARAERDGEGVGGGPQGVEHRPVAGACPAQVRDGRAAVAQGRGPVVRVPGERRRGPREERRIERPGGPAEGMLQRDAQRPRGGRRVVERERRDASRIDLAPRGRLMPRSPSPTTESAAVMPARPPAAPRRPVTAPRLGPVPPPWRGPTASAGPPPRRVRGAPPPSRAGGPATPPRPGRRSASPADRSSSGVTGSSVSDTPAISSAVRKFPR